MKKLLLICLAILCLVCSSYSQNDSFYGFYYANGTRHYWQEDFTSANIIVRNINHYDSIATSLRKVFNSTDDVVLADDEDNNIIVNSQSLASRNISELISSISLSNNDIAFFTFAKQVDGNPIWLTNEVYVKLKDNDYYVSHIQPILSQYPNVISYYEGKNEYRFVCPTDSVVATLANRLYDTAFVVYSSPDYYSLGELYNNDTYYSDQWNLNNTGQNGGTIGVDIKAEKAWAFLQKEIGSSGGNVKIAVIDDGVEEHEDFYEEHGVCVVLEGYTANGDGTGRPRPKNKHGECCAGIISAVHNNIGIAGVAPHSRIIPIRIFRNISNPNSSWYMFSSKKVARAIKKSWEEFGASVLSCSWGSSNPNDVINDAIVEAATNGRNGKGCIISFSSGNKAVYSIEQSVAAEATLDEVLAVGAIYANGMRHGESCYGLELDLVAPGYAIPTLDREGDYGETNGDYFLDFQRTSAACPHVSGVAALMLSARPELTREQVYEILERTAQKVGNYDYNNDYSYYHPNGTWNQEVGHGLVDAHMAVVEAALYGREVSLVGNDLLDLCDETEYTCSIHHLNNYTFEWTCSDNLALISITDCSARVMPISSGNAFVQVEVYSEGRLIRSLIKNLTITDENQQSLVPLATSQFNITTNTTWTNNNHLLPFNVIVESDATLTITGRVHCSNHANIIVKPGGRLILDGGKLTSSCPNSMWPGIEVWGNSAAHQYAVNGHYAQGYVELKNGAAIENAECALALWRPGHWGTTGGIVHADNATFRNCAKAVHALHYTNHHPASGKETHYNSRFRNCTFSIDNGYPGTTTFHKHADLNHVDGISFTGCDFSTDRNAVGVSHYCMGIAAYQSGFSAMAYCDHGNGNSAVYPCPDENLKGCSFEGFYRGIHASNNGSAARTFSVRQASFDNNTCGIHALNTGFATVIGCDFTVGCGSDCDFGILADHVTGFCIEENSFRPKHPGTGAPYGILIADSEGGNDIYRNTFSGLLCGNVAVGNNSQTAGNLQERTRNPGLTYTCNTNANNQIDFCVLDEGGDLAGIQQQQGSATLPAGNTFSGCLWHFHNGGDQTLDYHHYANGSGQTPDESLLHRVTPHPTGNANPCHPHYGGQGPLRSDSQKAEIEEAFLAAQAACDGLGRILDSRIDGGSTAAETADINTAAPSDLWRLRSKLLGHSPYLSQEALTAAADRHDVFPESVLFEILAANPDELKKDTLIRYMEQKESPLPQYLTDLLRQMASGATARTALLAQMGRYAHERDLAAGDIVRSNLNDTLADHIELRAWLGSLDNLAADRLAVASFVQQGNFGSALALAESLPELYGLQGGELNDHNDYMSLLSLYQTLDGEGRNALQLTDNEAAMVEGIAENGRGASRAMAEALLQSLSDDRVPESYCPTMPETTGGRGTAATPDPTLLNKALGFSASLTPNPATTWAAIDYTLPPGAAKATLTLTNALGVAVMTAELNGSQGQKVLDLRPLAAGVYGYALRCGEYVLNGKIIVTK